jgi:conjugal transfer pilus assembly protein TraE
MRLNKLIEDIESRTGVTRAVQLILMISLMTNALMAAGFVTMDKTVRTVLTPPEINKTFWVDGHRLSPEYLEQMGSWVISMFATVSPASVEYQTQTLLKYVDPSVFGDLSVRFRMSANRLKADNLTQIFLPREVRISEQGAAVAFIGTQSSWVADKRVPGDEQKAFLVAFAYDGARTFIKELRETDVKRPFDEAADPGPDGYESAALQAPSAR